jgi:DNA replication protein DnaC
MKAYKNVVELLQLLKLKGMVGSLDEVVGEAEARKLSYLSVLNTLLQAEISYRAERRFQRNMAAAHFPVPKSIEDFRFGRVKGIIKADVAQLIDFRWLDNHENLLFFGPPGLGKTHLSIALGMKAIEEGYTVCFEKIVNLIKLLKTQEIQRSAGFRINRILRSDLLIIDEIGYTPIDRKEANLFFNLVSELYEKKSIIITSNKGFESWAEMMGDGVMTTALLDRLLHHAKVFSLDGESYRIQSRKEAQ